MKPLRTFFLLLLLNMSLMDAPHAQSAFDKMTNEKMGKIIHREAEDIQGDPGRWQFVYRQLQLYIITDENANRMRIMSPIIEEKDLKKGQYKIMLEANFDKALDAKYGIYQDIVWSVFTHPLGELTVEQFKDAMDQVATLSANFGDSYSSTYWSFGAGEN